MSFSNQFLADADPENLRNIIQQQGQELEELKQSVLEFQRVSNVAEEGGELGETQVGPTLLDADGIHTDANLVDINWWLPLNLASDAITYIYCSAYDGVEYVYVGGQITSIGGVIGTTGYVIARYSLITRNWTVIGNASTFPARAMVYSAGALYVAGDFLGINGVANTAYIAKWNGSAWSALGTQPNTQVKCLAVDSGGNIYAGGLFSTIGGVSASKIAKWNGSVWSVLGTGTTTLAVLALAVDNSDRVWAGGNFTDMGGVAGADIIAMWDGAWNAVGTITSGTIYSLAVDTNTGYIYMGGDYTVVDSITVNRIAKYDGAAWNAMSEGVNGIVYAIAVDANSNVIIGGAFTDAGEDALVDRVAIFKDSEFEALSNAGGASGLDGTVYSLLVLPNGSIVAGGSFNYVGAIQCQSVAMYCKPLSEAIDIIASLFELYSINSSGTYTPTLTNTTNIAASTPYLATYQRIGNVIHVFGSLDVDPTAGAANTVLGVSLPIASALTNAFQLSGTGTVDISTATRPAVAIVGDVANDRATFLWWAPDGTNRNLPYHFSYLVV